ncbi:MAG: glycosyl transferase family protein, partial [Alcaligenaceae bacterium]
YCNDAATIREVERMRRRYRQLVRVEVPHAGPTCKADCLNWIVQAIFKQEQLTGQPYAGAVLHDSEDILHPLELKYYNYLLPRIDFIQLPVTSLQRHWYELVAGTYMDEFAEWHSKDLVVRESMSGSVPSAGVGTCFSHKALAELSRQTCNQPFNTDSLTEDYDIGARLGRLGMKQIFGLFNVEYAVHRKTWFGFGQDRIALLSLPMSVREYFPDTVKTAYRQKARWTLGIGLQGWQQVGWEGSLATKYLLFRDRKGLVTSFIAIIAYIVFAQYLLFYLADVMGWWDIYFPSAFAPDSWVAWVMAANLVAITLRIIQRFYFVGRMYGPVHAALSLPRMVVANVVNALAAARAWRLFLGSVLLKRALVWDKTMHDFPSSEQLAQQRLRLGELLLTWQAIDTEDLAAALKIQSESHEPLGQILVDQGWLSADMLQEALAFQNTSDEIAMNELSTHEHRVVDAPLPGNPSDLVHTS